MAFHEEILFFFLHFGEKGICPRCLFTRHNPGAACSVLPEVFNLWAGQRDRQTSEIIPLFGDLSSNKLAREGFGLRQVQLNFVSEPVLALESEHLFDDDRNHERESLVLVSQAIACIRGWQSQFAIWSSLVET
jgi:hypothetical protein